MPHGYKIGSDIHPHVHWLPQTTSTGTVNWQLEYSIANINSVLGNTTTIQMPGVGAGIANTHQLTDASPETIDGSSLTLSNMMLGRLFRDGGVGADTFVGDAALMEFDLHFEKDTVGSRQEIIK
jgi:hypothetical protein